MGKVEFNYTQFLKFTIIGVLNTAVDFAVLNFLIWLFKVYSGWPIILLNSISFSCAVVNSYFLNKYWTFAVHKKEKVNFSRLVSPCEIPRSGTGSGEARQFPKFFLISLIGILINSGIVYLGTTFVKTPFDFPPAVWVNTVKLLAVAVSLVWNFAGYKVFVFKNQENKTT